MASDHNQSLIAVYILKSVLEIFMLMSLSVYFSYYSEAKAMGERRSEFQQNTSVKRKSENDVDHVFLRFGKRG